MMDKECREPRTKETKNMTKNKFTHVDHYLVSQPCGVNETEVTR